MHFDRNAQVSRILAHHFKNQLNEQSLLACDPANQPNHPCDFLLALFKVS
jgi:hypothetical protein